MLKSSKNIFFYWDKGESSMPVIHKVNIENIRNRLKNSEWNIVVTSLDKTSKYYIGNLIDLPSYFFDIQNKITNLHSMGGNLSDIIRLRLLGKYGGIYFDTSTIFLKNKIEDIKLYNKLINSSVFKLAGYTNFTFTRKSLNGNNYFENAKDGIELGVLFAKKHSKIIKIFNQEIDKFWEWKTTDKSYLEYPLFKKYKLKKVSFLNEYHIHYTIFHMIITRDTSLLKELITQSIHMKNKENSLNHGAYTLTDMFCRGKTNYDKADPKILLEVFLDKDLEFKDKFITLKDRIKLIDKMELIVIPGYLRVELERYFRKKEDFQNLTSLYQYILKSKG